MRSGEKVFHSAAGALSGVVGECVEYWSRVVRHSVKRKKRVVSEWYVTVAWSSVERSSVGS